MKLTLILLQVGPLPIGDDATYVQQYDDGHIPWVKRPGDDLGDTGAMVIPMPVSELYMFCRLPLYNASCSLYSLS